MRKFLIAAAQPLTLAVLLLAAPLAHAQDGGKMTDPKMQSGRMTDNKMSHDSKMSKGKMSKSDKMSHGSKMSKDKMKDGKMSDSKM